MTATIAVVLRRTRAAGGLTGLHHRDFDITVIMTTTTCMKAVLHYINYEHLTTKRCFCMLFHLYSSRCHSANLNGLYHRGPYSAVTDDGIVWYPWHGWWYSLKSVQMKIRPASFEANDV